MFETEFCNHSGKAIYTGDIVLWRLGKFAKKSSGPSHFQVIATKKGPKLADNHGAGWLLRKSYEQYLTIVDTRQRETSSDQSRDT